jgi:virginiamycin B lyase
VRKRVWAVASFVVGLGLWIGQECARAESIREFTLPSAALPTGIAVAPDGSVWIAVAYADKLLRFDPESGRFAERRLPSMTRPRSALVDSRGNIWFTASGLGAVERLLRAGGELHEFAVPSVLTARYALPAPSALTLERRTDEVWFTVASHGMIGRVAARAEPLRHGFRVRELQLGGPTSRPEGIAADGRGGVWVAELGSDRLARIDVRDGSIRRLTLPAGSRPRAVAAAPDGVIWVTLFGSHRLLRVDPVSFEARAWPMPSGARSNPYAVATDSAGRVWVSEYSANTIARFDPTTERFQVFPLPTPNSRVQAIAVDARGRLWYVGSFSGRVGVLQ